MKVRILGTESLGVRGLCCEVQVKDRHVVIDPGIALGYRRHGLLPHPAQVAVGEQIRQEIIVALENATDVVFSHFHGDHIPLPDANPYQLNAYQVAQRLQTVRLWAKGPDGIPPRMAARREALTGVLGEDLPNSEGECAGPLSFSRAVAHGKPQMGQGSVMMTCIKDEDGVFVHASDIQLLNNAAIRLILAWQPDIVLVSGPPLYLSRLSPEQQQLAWRNGLRLAQGVATLILDHHLLRCEAGLRWLDRLASTTGKQVLCAADFMNRPRCMLEAWRPRLYGEMPVPGGWHDAYACGNVDANAHSYYIESCDR